MPTNISNIKVTQNGVIKNWWKLSYVDGYKFTDRGDGDEDFYAYWYSICYLTGALNLYRHLFRDIHSYEQMLRRFLKSREIAFKNDSSLDTLKYIYDHFVDDIKKRGTVEISHFDKKSEEIGINDFESTSIIEDDIDFNAGVGIVNNYANNLIGFLSESINLGAYYEIKFDVLLKNDFGDIYFVNGDLIIGETSNLNIAYVSPGQYTLTHTLNGSNIGLQCSIDPDILNTIKFVRHANVLAIYINEELKTKVSNVSSTDTFDIIKLFSSGLPAIANIELIKKDVNNDILDVISWACNEGSGFTLESNQAPLYSAQLDINNNFDWNSIWRRSSLFDNTNYIGIDGEIRRILNYIDGECLHELVATSELGLSIDMSSPISEEANCGNFNKAYCKGVITKLSSFPAKFGASVKPFVSGGYLQYNLSNYNNVFYGINADLLSNKNWKTNFAYKPVGQTPFIPINVATDPDDIDGYEISFVIQSLYNIQLKFGIATYDESFDLLVDKTKAYDTNVYSDIFFQSSSFALCKGRDVLIRGVYSMKHDSLVSDTMNINLGTNLYNSSQSTVKYIVPIIAFMSSAWGQSWVKIKDIVIRPLSLPTSKGVIGNKNTIVSYLRNDSGSNDSDVKTFIDDKLIPYNCVTNIQFL
jgi:hypothetical protein